MSKTGTQLRSYTQPRWGTVYEFEHILQLLDVDLRNWIKLADELTVGTPEDWPKEKRRVIEMTRKLQDQLLSIG